MHSLQPAMSRAHDVLQVIIEKRDALARHPAVVMAAAVGVPDPIRTESIKAFVVLRDGFSPSHQLVRKGP